MVAAAEDRVPIGPAVPFWTFLLASILMAPIRMNVRAATITVASKVRFVITQDSYRGAPKYEEPLRGTVPRKPEGLWKVGQAPLRVKTISA
jgi:hypothetical protein